MTVDTLLFRQIHPQFVIGGIVGQLAFDSDQVIDKAAFIPTTKDQGLLSTYDGDKYDPHTACHHYVTQLGLKTHGVLAVSVSECESEHLPCIDDQDEPFMGHCSIDFRKKDKRERRISAEFLKDFAVARGWLSLNGS